MVDKKILLVDDNEDDLLLTRRILVGEHYKVLTAKSGLTALEIFTRRKSEIFIVLLDVFLPDSDGRKLALKMKAIAPNMPIILLSQYGYKGMSAKWGVDDIDYVMKDEKEKLITLIKKYEKKASTHPGA